MKAEPTLEILSENLVTCESVMSSPPPHGFASFTRTAGQPLRYCALRYLTLAEENHTQLSSPFNLSTLDLLPFTIFHPHPALPRITNKTILTLSHTAHSNGLTIRLGLKPNFNPGVEPTKASRKADTR